MPQMKLAIQFRLGAVDIPYESLVYGVEGTCGIGFVLMVSPRLSIMNEAVVVRSAAPIRRFFS